MNHHRLTYADWMSLFHIPHKIFKNYMPLSTGQVQIHYVVNVPKN